MFYLCYLYKVESNLHQKIEIMTTSTRELELELLEKKSGQTLLSSHMMMESKTTLWRLRLTKWDSSGRKNWRMWCERNGEFLHGTEQCGKNLSQDLKEAFNL